MKFKILSVLLVLGCCLSITALGQERSEAKKIKPRPTPVLQLEKGVLQSRIEGVVRPNDQVVCTGDTLSFRANVSGVDDAEKLNIRWVTAVRRRGELVAMENVGVSDGAGSLIINSANLPPGVYVVTAETLAPFKECEGGCTAYDSKTFVVAPCEPKPVCFTSPTLTLTSATQIINPGELVNICSTQVTGGYNYGPLAATWSSTAGSISGDTSCARLNTTGVAPGSSITVALRLIAVNLDNCEANGTITFRVAQATVASTVELTPCDTFKRDSARVDNVCKAILGDLAKQLEADPQARLVIDSYYRRGERPGMGLERGKNVRDRLADGSIGVKIDANRLIVRPSGKADDGEVVRFYWLPAGAVMPSGASIVDVGNVSQEPRRTTRPRP